MCGEKTLTQRPRVTSSEINNRPINTSTPVCTQFRPSAPSSSRILNTATNQLVSLLSSLYFKLLFGDIFRPVWCYSRIPFVVLQPPSPPHLTLIYHPPPPTRRRYSKNHIQFPPLHHTITTSSQSLPCTRVGCAR